MLESRVSEIPPSDDRTISSIDFMDAATLCDSIILLMSGVAPRETLPDVGRLFVRLGDPVRVTEIGRWGSAPSGKG